MSSGSYPKWIRIHYHEDGYSTVKKYLGSISYPEKFVEVFDQYGIKEQSIICYKVDDKIQDEKSIRAFYRWLDKKRREMQEDEERKKTDS